MENIKINSFNVRGLAESSKRRTVFHWLKRFHDGITLLQETHSTIALEQKWQKEWDGEVIFSHGTANSKGVAIMFPKGLDYKIETSIIDDYGRYILLKVQFEYQNIILINVYAPTKDKEADQILFITEISKMLEDFMDQNIIIGGDFNVCLDPMLDKKGGKIEQPSRYSKEILSLNENFNLVDIWRILNPEDRKFTWRGMTRNGLVQSRLDFWLISIHSMYDLIKVNIKPGIKSDHSLISLHLNLKLTQQRGKGFWKFNCSLLKDADYVTKVKNVLQNCAEKYNNFENKSLLWDTIKCEIRTETISYASWKARQRRQLGQDLEKQLNILEDQLSKGQPVLDQYSAIKIELENFNEDIAKGAFIRSRAKFVEEDEKCTKFFFQQEKRNSKVKHIKCLNIDNKTITDPKHILDEQAKFYSNLYTQKTDLNNCVNECSLFDTLIPNLSEEEKLLCDEIITIEECGKSLKALDNNKSPGSDGLTTEFYKFFGADIKHHVFNSFQYALHTGTLSLDQRRALLTLLPKSDKDLRLLKNWRPLSLLNTDYKILTKLLAERLQKVLPNIISEDQAGYIKGRFIGENVRTILDIIDYTSNQQKTGIAVFLDFEKAFDTISWSFLLKTLEKFNFGSEFIKWVKVLYNKPLCCVSNNGHSSTFFQISRGIRQGCPLSALLFIIVAEIMSINIRNSDNIKGLTFSGNNVTITQLADDTTLFLEDDNSLLAVFALLDHFYKCSGLKLNKEKTEAMQLGNDSQRKNNSLGIKWVNGAIKILGIWLNKDENEIIKTNFEIKLQKVKNLVNMWKSQKLSLKGKITLLRAQAMPIILYPASILFIPEEIIKELDQIFFNFIWPSQKHHVKKDVIIQPIEEGGLKMPDIQTMIKAIKISWVKRLVSKTNNFSLVAKQVAQTDSFGTLFSYNTNIKYIDNKIPSFYKQIMEYWLELYSTNPTNPNDILNEILWFNKNIIVGDKPLYYKKWAENGIKTIKDITNKDGFLLNTNELSQKLNFVMPTMKWNSLISAIPQHWKKSIRFYKGYEEPLNNLHLRINNINKPIEDLFCKDFYWEFIRKRSCKPAGAEKWEDIYYFIDFDWKYIYSLPYHVARETHLQSLQYQILNRFIPCKYALKLWNKEDSELCDVCNTSDTIEHFFVKCNKVVPFWNSFNQWFSRVTETQITLGTFDIIFGIPNVNNHTLLNALNYCILLAKKIIYNCQIEGKVCSFYQYQTKLKSRLDAELYLCTESNKVENYLEQWQEIYNGLP